MPEKRSNPKTMHRAVELRRNPTEAEAKLWKYLRAHRLGGIGFRRQHAIGNYIVDFCAPRAKIVIEVDGSQHSNQREYDADRTAFLEAKGYAVLRFWNNEVLNNIDIVLNRILDEVQSTSPK